MSREAFEAWWEINYHNGNPPRFGWAAYREDGGYKIDDDESELDSMWNAWQAATSAMEAKCAALAAENAALKSVVRECQGYFIAGIRNTIRPTNEGYLHMRCDTAADETPSTDAFLAEVRAQGVEEFLRDSQLPYQIATVLADYDNVDDATLQTVIWSGQPPEPDGDVWHLEYVSRGNTIVRAILKGLREGVQS